MTVLRAFSFEHNRREVIAQEYHHARQHMTEVRQFLDYSRDDHVVRYLDAQERLNRARELMLRG